MCFLFQHIISFCFDTQFPAAHFEQLTCGSEVATKYLMTTNIFGVCSKNVSQDNVYPYHIISS
jgi:hypothetical protein